MTGHVEYCPIAVGVEILGDRWTPLVIRELSVGATGFNEIARGLPRLSRTLLSQRLRMLERRGLVWKEPAPRGQQVRYSLTASGAALSSVVWSLGQWAAEWTFGDPTDEECDGLTLMWRLHQCANPGALPAERTVVHLVLTGPGAAQGWLDIADGGVTVCQEEPAREPDLVIEAPTSAMLRWLMSVATFRELRMSGQVRLTGPAGLVRQFPDWFITSMFAESLGRARRRQDQEAVPA
ncbi:DNA-binding transcriptional regulator, HxlR family [Parafrankia irregularis]|uniref:DNA-binding transcriptional regulator, HxlR family n=1 Tax=Parafrankia irregularis TaxID=795642 RepID=A0A0S4QM65_9ACTN|nr:MULTISPECIES: helix-turn-helix domain-containing protein [Parafrankia]MBE3201370.1 helix-turn-helix transcriptional regulator [Parafrankia sp. CH37]CUU56174.1 DNA-binding transcriptional regulator, HxlR family [Parafrankia irregularis]